MARPDRLFRLLHAMRVMSPPITAQRLAEETGVSRRSLYRDIDSLRAAGALIEGERGYGYRLVEDYALPPQTFDRMEIEAIVLGLGEVRHMGDPALATAAASVLAKVAATLPTDREQQLLHSISHVFRPEPRMPQLENLPAIRQACWDEHAVEIHYRDREERGSRRTVYPLALMYADKVLTVLTWCCLREAFRMFRIDRISALRPTGTSFRPRRVTLLRAYLNDLSERGSGAATS